MHPITVAKLRRMSGKAISALPGPVAVKSGDRIIALLVPAKAAGPDRRAEEPAETTASEGV